MAFQLMHSSSQDTLRIGYTNLFTRQIDSSIDNVQQMATCRLMDTYTGFVKTAVSAAHRILWKSSNWLQAISSLQDSCKDQSQAVSEAFTQKLVQPRTRSHTLQCLVASLLLPACAYVHVCDVTTAIDEQWRSTGRQSAQNSTTDVSFCTIIIGLSQCTVVITIVPSQAFPASCEV